jgi:hypothetical protein
MGSMSTTVKSERTTRGDGSRFYTLDGKRYWSVTTTLGAAVPKQRALVPWAAKEVATAVVIHDREDVLHRLQEINTANESLRHDLAEALIKDLKGSPYKKRDRAANIGTQVHEHIDKIVTGTPVGAPALPIAAHIASFDAWLAVTNPEFEASELTVYSDKHEYAGTLDAIVEIDGEFYVVDYKTSAKGPYPEVALQLAAYARADFGVMRDGRRVEIPTIAGGIVLSIVPPEPAVQMPVDIGDEVFEVFLALQKVHFRWFNDLEKRVLGERADA